MFSLFEMTKMSEEYFKDSHSDTDPVELVLPQIVIIRMNSNYIIFY